MICRVGCYLCGETVGLDDLAFNTRHCDCAGKARCEHGVCSNCDDADMRLPILQANGLWTPRLEPGFRPRLDTGQLRSSLRTQAMMHRAKRSSVSAAKAFNSMAAAMRYAADAMRRPLFDVFVISRDAWKALKAEFDRRDGAPPGVEGGVQCGVAQVDHMMGVPVYVYGTDEECLAKAYELALEGKRPMVFVDSDEPEPDKVA